MCWACGQNLDFLYEKDATFAELGLLFHSLHQFSDISYAAWQWGFCQHSKSSGCQTSGLNRWFAPALPEEAAASPPPPLSPFDVQSANSLGSLASICSDLWHGVSPSRSARARLIQRSPWSDAVPGPGSFLQRHLGPWGLQISWSARP